MKTVYKCEICGSVYETPKQAEFCETYSPLPQPKYAVGDRIAIKDCEGEVNVDSVLAVAVAPAMALSSYKSWLNDGDKGIDGFLAVCAKYNSHQPLHEYYYTVQDHHMLSDEWNTKEIPEDRIIGKRAEAA
ncbi:MAG TPA: hypothetical protein VN476_14945 [Pyrinomonadaceae bacterium]|nr:hypothetical protein [Pyrinomonadaceae bacterium]